MKAFLALLAGYSKRTILGTIAVAATIILYALLRITPAGIVALTAVILIGALAWRTLQRRVEPEQLAPEITSLLHELRRPLANITAAAALLRDERAARQVAESIVANAAHARRILDDIGDIERSLRPRRELHRHRPQPAPTDEQLRHIRDVAIAHGATVRTKTDADADVLLIDITIPGVDKEQLIARIKEAIGGTEIVDVGAITVDDRRRQIRVTYPRRGQT